MSTLVQTGEWQPQIALPLLHSNLTVDDILSKADDTDELSEDSDGLMRLIYRGTLFSAEAKDYVPGLLPGSSLTGAAIGGPYSQFLPIDSLDMNLELYNKVLGGNFYFDDPIINVIVTNSLGVPVDMTFTVLEAYSPLNGILPIMLWTSTAPPGIALNNPSPPVYPTVPGDTAVTIYSFDKNNSNILDFLQIGPRYIMYSVQATVNPLGLTTPSFFVMDTNMFSVEVEVELPLYGTANFVTLGDTMPFDLSINDPSGSELIVTSATFMVNAYNDFPVEVELQVLFIDSNDVILDSLFTDGQQLFLGAANVGPAPVLHTTSPTHTVTELYIDRARLDKLNNAVQAVVLGRITTSNSGNTMVKIYSDYEIEFKLGVNAKLKFGE